MLWEQTKLKLSLLPLRPTLAWLNKEPGRFWLSVTGSQPAKERLSQRQLWLDRYQAIRDDRLKSGDIRLNTYKQKAKPVSLLRERAGMKLISAVDVRDIAQLLDEYIAAGRPRMAQVVRSVLIDVFKEAQHYGEVPPAITQH